MWPRVAVIILNWNGLQDTLDCLGSLGSVDYPEYDVLVVDNGSGDGSPAAIRAGYPDVALWENPRNLGFTGGNNVGIRRALERGADYVLLLNNDTCVAPNFLRELVAAAEADPEIGAAGPTIYYHVAPDVIWSAGGIVDWRQGDIRMRGTDEKDAGQFGSAPQEVDFITGCAMLLKRAALERVGGLDERFFAYYEESEWCLRARRAGWRVVHVPAARIWHKIDPDRRSASALVHYYMTRNRLLFLRLAGAGLRAWGHTLLVEYLRTLISWSVKPRWRHKGPQRRAMVQAITDFYRGRFNQMEGM
ncbi:MAG: glycosyltransferase family 2 protein [Anaerolineae bacterium]|nr:glycosyltransferase family 2 protein [Anaerolineae bacterium]